MEALSGATGQLFLTRDGKVHRKLAWARFERGEPVALPDADALQDPFESPEDFGDEPTDRREPSPDD